MAGCAVVMEQVRRFGDTALFKTLRDFPVANWGKLNEELGMRCTTTSTILTGRTMTKPNALVPVGGGRLLTPGGSDWIEVEYREFQVISDRANRLLSREEGLDVVFKKSISGLATDDLVSFANSKAGGAILIGVNQTKHGNGRLSAALVGCPIGGRERLKILAKSNQCVPPVPVSIFAENCADKPFYRIEISSGLDKPYCTSGGTYKIRISGRNEVLYPPQLLTLFLETEGGEFVRWRQRVTSSLGSVTQETKQLITTERRYESQSAWDMESSMKESLRGLAGAVSGAVGNAEDADTFAERAGECDVLLSSQDLCGFLMRLP